MSEERQEQERPGSKASETKAPAAAGKPKAPPAPSLSRLAADALVESIDGPVEIGTLIGKFTPVLTRMANGTLGFRMMREIREVDASAPRLEIENGDGQVVRVGLDHVFVREDGREIRAEQLAVGDRLEASWSYPAGYVPPDAGEYAAAARGVPWVPAVTIASIRQVDVGPLIAVSVNETRAYYLTFGARCRAQA